MENGRRFRTVLGCGVAAPSITFATSVNLPPQSPGHFQVSVQVHCVEVPLVFQCLSLSASAGEDPFLQSY
ncbi:hypothetical protein MtrunA17_Chr1g0184051 [Medicago truncatula]|uniref:Uncharacterized protein n=1 Tax=Medicago truncatula TaxID=3880 RepID=A0A396JTF7_MEDTR|nr:hypothetical protein MtrunA17_Chr1g0184051 [Medicago truncatula]